MNKIDDKTSVPLVWVLGVISVIASGVWVTASFVNGMQSDVHELRTDVKLIKKKLKIDDGADSARSGGLIFEDANATSLKR